MKGGGLLRRGKIALLAVLVPAVVLLFMPQRSRTADSYVGWKTCVSCHEGYEKPFGSTMHYKLFDSDKTGQNIGCESCHGPGADHLANPGEKIIKLKPTEAKADEISKVCLRCHDRSDMVAGFRHSAHFRKGVACTSCHLVHKKGAGEVNLVQKQPDLCFSCHPEKQAQINMPNRHPIKEGKVLCSDCHNPHSNVTGKQYSKNCVSCHPEKAGPFRSEHQPVVESCLNCHSPHGAANKDLLNFTQPGLCLRCHADDMFITHNIASASYNKCTKCHTRIHGSNAARGADGDPNLF